MFVSGFSFVRNAIKYDYPIVEAITSILPICDEFVIAVGNSEDDTLNLIKSINSDKIRIIETIWDDSLREGGKVLAVETDKALAEISQKADWAFYIQGDEVVHEKYLDEIKSSMSQYKDNQEVDGLLFRYTHFYGSYKYIGDSTRWYDKEIRIIRPKRNIYSYRDAQGFRKGDNQKLKVKEIKAEIYHYGWVKMPETMQKKQEDFNKLWHDDAWIEDNIPKVVKFDYTKIDKLKLFSGTHPAVMTGRIQDKKYNYEIDLTGNRSSTKDKVKKFLRKIGINLSYQNYIKI